MGLLNISPQQPIKAPDEPRIVRWRECSKKFVQQGRSHFDERSVLIVREHAKMARTPLAAFFNIPIMYPWRIGNEEERIRRQQVIRFLWNEGRISSCEANLNNG
jgi:hypothetical protein